MLFLLQLITSRRIYELSEIGSVPLISDNRGSTVREEQYCAFCWPGVPSVAALTRRSVTLAVADASGRYTPSFFWGNSYWTGSESLCHQLNSNTPPFSLGFYTVRLQIALPHNISPRVSIFFPNSSTAPWGPRPPNFSTLHDHTHFRHTTRGRNPLYE